MSLYFDLGANRSLSNLDAEGEEKFTDKQDTLVSGENIKTINGVSVLGEGNIEVGEGGTITVNQTYDPTSSYAQSGTAVADALANSMESITQNGTISNCILEIPQNIKLTLENNVLTLKSGSILTKTGSTYSTLTTTADISRNIGNDNLADDTYMVFCSGTSIPALRPLSKIASGDSSGYPTSELDDFNVYFNINDKKIYRYSVQNTQWEEFVTYYPLCLVEVASGVASFVKDSNGNDMIFNGCGFIGHHFFGFPNVECLIPNGIDDKGLLKSTFHRANAVVIFEMRSYSKYMTIPFGDRWIDYTEVDTYADFLAQYPTALVNTRFYVKELNKTFVYAGGSIGILEQGRLPIAKYTYDGTTVTDFTIRQPVRLATTEMLDNKQDVLTSITGYDSTKTQTLKNVNGTLTWVDD